MGTATYGRAARAWGWMGLLLGVAGLAAAGRALALPPLPGLKKDAKPAAPAAAAPAAGATASDYSQRVVAYINGDVRITREDLGEYLIAREGAEKLELLVNKKIIDLCCKEKGVEVTAAEVDAALAEDVKGMGVDVSAFVNQVLKHYHKTLYEWKEDVIRPRLALSKLCRDRVKITDEDVRDAFEAHYGEKVDCRLILFPKGEVRQALTVHAKVRDSDEEFNRFARQQASPSLAATGGQVRPIGRHTTGNEQLEKEAFSLRPGEVSSVIDTPEGPVILKCVARIPAEKSKTLDSERAKLEKEIFEKKLQQEIPVYFKELRDKARPVLILGKKYLREDELMRDVRQELSSDPATMGSTTKPGGNK